MARPKEPRHFYLNEQHELAREARDGGGSLPKLAPIDWLSKQAVITQSLAHTKRAIHASEDPLKGQRYFLLARPERTLRKLSEDKRKAPEGEFEEPIDYAGRDAKVLGRLGLDVVSVSDIGAVVHATPAAFDRLQSIGANLQEVGRAEQARWAPVAAFDTVPNELRADRAWLESLRPGGENEVIVELQPLLTRVEGGLVLSDIASRFSGPQREAILGSGSDFSGRAWFRARLTLRTVSEIVARYFSVQAIHGPLLSPLVQVRRSSGPARAVEPADPRPALSSPLPSVAVVDGGVPLNHRQLERHRRGTFIDPDSPGVLGGHGTFVASRVVFGDSPDPISTPPVPTCQFLDVVVARDAETVDDKIVSRAVNTVAVNFPDVRTFNLSFGDYVALGQHEPVQRNERLLLTQDLDNVVFARDIIVVVAAGNSRPSTPPSMAYPDNWQDPTWGLGHWALGFNSLTCGSFVSETTILGGVATVPLAPSPFCRVGPGLADTLVPDFAAHGGNGDDTYRGRPGLGVFGLSVDGLWEDRPGTSFAAPLLARECAFVFQFLQALCPTGVRPFSVTVKALMALTASPHNLPEQFRELAERTLGHGQAISRVSSVPVPDSALFVWQGIINDKSDMVKVVVPIPTAWLSAANDPVCDVSVSWDTPVNAAFPNVYGCRRVDVKLRSLGSGKAARPSHGSSPSLYPLRVRTHSLKKLFIDGEIKDDLWVLELSYEELCDYPAAQIFIPEQRVGLALRLRDRGGIVSPQEFVQNHPLSATMNRLAVTVVPSRVPVTLRSS